MIFVFGLPTIFSSPSELSGQQAPAPDVAEPKPNVQPRNRGRDSRNLKAPEMGLQNPAQSLPLATEKEAVRAILVKLISSNSPVFTPAPMRFGRSWRAIARLAASASRAR